MSLCYNILAPKHCQLLQHKENLNFIVATSKSSSSLTKNKSFSFCNLFYEPQEYFERDSENQNIQQSEHNSELSKKSDDQASLGSNIVETDCGKLITRTLLEPSQCIELKVTFGSQEPGNFSEQFLICVSDYTRTSIVTITANVELPCIDLKPCNIFEKILETSEGIDKVSLTYICDSMYFEYGAALMTKPKEKPFHQTITIFGFYNISHLPVEQHFFLKNKDAENFLLETNVLKIPRGQRHFLSVSATPRNLGLCEDILYFSIKNNPCVYSIKLRCYGIKPEFAIEPKTLSFDHILLFSHATHFLNFTNKSTVNLHWRFENYQDFSEHFEFSKHENEIAPQEKQVIHIGYESHSEHVVKNMPLNIEVFVNHFTGEPVICETVLISAETFDVKIDIGFEDQASHLDFGCKKINIHHSLSFFMKNHGTYDTIFRISAENLKDDIENDFLINHIKVYPIDGIIPKGGKLFTIKVTIYPMHSLNIREVPCLWVYLYNVFNKERIIAVIPINLSIQVLCSSYLISPFPVLDFGSMSINDFHQLEINIENTGIFPFTFSIDPLKSNYFPIARTVSSKLDKKKIEKNNHVKKNDKSLIIGPYKITPSEGKIEPKETSKMIVNCQSSTAGNFDEKCVINFSETIYQEIDKNILTLSAIICKPFINFEDIYTLFKEVNIIDEFKNFLNFKMGSSGCTFIRDNNTLHFSNVCIGDQETAALHFVNQVRVPCSIQVFLTGDSSAFSLNQDKLIVESYSYKMVKIIFSPSRLQLYKSEIKVIHAEKNIKYGEFVFHIEGWGCLPEVIISQPKFLEEKSIQFSNTIVGRYAGRKIHIKNVSNIPCRVILELLDNEEDAFELWPCASTLPNLIHSEKIEKTIPFTRILVVCLKPEKEEKFGICFRPQFSKDLHEAQINCTIINNPYECIKIKLLARSFTEDMVLDGLNDNPINKTFDPDLLSVEYVESNVESERMYNIDLGVNEIWLPVHKTIILSNISPAKTYRYQWIYQEEKLEIEPILGHLIPKTSIELKITYVPIEPSEFQETVECRICEIQIEDDKAAQSSWNIKETRVHYETENNEDEQDVDVVDEPQIYYKLDQYEQNDEKKNILCEILEKRKSIKKTKIVSLVPEPPYAILPSSDKVINLNIHSQSMYNSLEYDNKEIVFRDTLLFQHCEHILTFTNASPLKLRYHWEIEECRGRYVHRRPKSTNRPKSNQSVREEVYVTPEGKMHLKCRRFKPIKCNECKDNISNDVETLYSLAARMALEPVQPFTIEPPYGSVPPNSECKTKIIFSPLDTLDFKTRLKLACCNLPPDTPPISTLLRGKGLMPYCYFDIETSDYLSSGRGNSKQTSKIDLDKIKVVEFNVIGLNSFQKKFYIYNPTDESWEFSWRTDYPDKPKFFCHPSSGMIESGKKSECEITFVPDLYGEFEQLFSFHICRHNIVEWLLLVGVCSQPNQYFLHTNITLPPVLLGSSTCGTAILVNDETQILHFAFDPTIPQMTVTPMRGTIEENSEKQIRITFEPQMKGDKSLRISCQVKGHVSPLYLSILTVCHKVHPIISLVTPNNRVYSLDPYQPNILDLEKVLKNKPLVVTFNITNAGKMAFKFDFRYDLQFLKKHSIRMKCSDRGSIITPEARASCTLVVTFLSVISIKNFEIFLEISRGPRYLVLMSANSYVPKFKFSFSYYDFGLCFIDKDHTSIATANLEFTNLENEPATLDLDFSDLPYLKIEVPRLPIESKQKVKIPIYFSPLENVEYSKMLKFIVNGQTEYIVKINGQGESVKVIPLISDKLIKFGTVKRNSQVTRTIHLKNHNQIPVHAKFWIAYSTEQDATPAIKDITVEPSQLVIAKLSTIKLTIIFKPLQRLTPFNLKILSKYTGTTPEPICFLQGSCADYEFSVDRKTIPFGSVIINTNATRNIVLFNTGDLGSSFHLKFEHLPNTFKITPEHGYISPGMSIIFNYTFSPKIIESFRLYTVLLYIDDYQESPLKLTLSTSSVSLPEPSSIVEFRCPVRQEQTINLLLENKSQTSWHLKPKFTGDVFSGPVFVNVNPNSTNEYPITYRPLYMTNDETPNKETIIFPFDEGTVLIYSLVGNAGPPSCEEYIVREIPCKTSYIELFSLSNWLNIAQRLRFSTNLVKTEKFDPVIIMSGSEFIDIPINASRQYRCYFYIFKPCKLIYEIQFTDVSTNEYVFFSLELNVTPCAPLDTIEVSCRTFVSRTFYIRLQNILKIMDQLKDYVQSPLKYQFSLASSNGTLPLDSLRLPSEPIFVYEDDVNVPCVWLPVFEGEWTAIVDAYSPELGSFPYRLELSATSPTIFPSIQMSESLGFRNIYHHELNNFTLHQTVFKCQVNHKDFTVGKNTVVSGGSTNKVEISFEPSEIGSIAAILTATSDKAGQFCIPIAAIGLPPPVQGPFVVKYNSTPLQLNFKNVFKESKKFIIRVHPNECFKILSSNQLTIDSKKEVQIEISVVHPEKEDIEKIFPDAGKLTVSCQDSSSSNIVWSYYLKAER